MAKRLDWSVYEHVAFNTVLFNSFSGIKILPNECWIGKAPNSQPGIQVQPNEGEISKHYVVILSLIALAKF